MLGLYVLADDNSLLIQETNHTFIIQPQMHYALHLLPDICTTNESRHLPKVSPTENK